jgi:hypothetical protein
MKKTAVSLCLLFSTSYLLAQSGIATKEAYLQAFTDLKNMLTGKDSIDYERAVFITENAYYNNVLDYSDFKNMLDYHTKMITLMAENARQEHAKTYKTLTGYQKTMFMQNTANWAIFSYITDTTFFAPNKMLYSTPYTYSVADPYGTAHWEHTQVINLLVNKTGNCYALAALFKLFSNRLQSDARLTIAPNHIYIENRNAKGDFKNVELATKTFPGDGSIQTLTYTTRELIMNGMAQRSLNDTAAVALNLIYLAKGYEKAFTNSTDDFIENCADVAFKYDTLSLNALLLKAELTENRLLEAMTTNKLTTATQARANIKTQKLLANYEKQLNNLYKLGYREIPKNIAQLITAAKQGNNDGYITTNETPNPFASMGKSQRYATLSWGLFDEMHAPQDTISYFRTSFNTKKKKVIAFAEIDTAINYKVDPVVFACSVDPLTSKFAWYSPYQYAGNTPIVAIDMDGLEDVWTSEIKYPDGYTVTTTIFKGDKNYESQRETWAKSMGITVKMLPKTGSLTTTQTYDAEGKITGTQFHYTATTEVTAFKNNIFVRALRAADGWINSKKGNSYGEMEGQEGFETYVNTIDNVGEGIEEAGMMVDKIPIAGKVLSKPFQAVGGGLGLTADIFNTAADIDQKGFAQGTKNGGIRLGFLAYGKVIGALGGTGLQGGENATKTLLNFTGERAKDGMINKSNNDYYESLKEFKLEKK